MDIFLQIVTLGVIVVISYLVLTSNTAKANSSKKDTTPTEPKLAGSINPHIEELIERLRKELPLHTISLPNEKGFNRKLKTTEDLATAIKSIKLEYDQQRSNGKAGALFAIRGGGHNAVAGAASIENGILIDLSLLNSIKIADDRETVSIGGGAKWVNVTEVLDAADLAAAGGRASQVGVGGLTLGGGISYFSPRFGLVCSNVVSYEVVLASGTIVTASATSNPRLWRALKGGPNNFGIVTKFILKAFPSSNFWSGWLIMPPFQPQKTMIAFHEFAGRCVNYDPYAAGPILVFSFAYPLGIKLTSLNLAYTKQPDNQKNWPECFANSRFSSLWRLRNTCKIQSLTSMITEMDGTTPPGKRQMLVTTTIKNCVDTMKEIHSIVTETNSALRRKGSKSWVWGLVLQPIFPDMMRKGNGNCLGLMDQEETLINVLLSIMWNDASLDTTFADAARITVDSIEAMAKQRQTWHRYKYANYCGTWQNPFSGYGSENLQFLRDVSKEVDPDELFQQGCPGGFKLWSNADGED